MVFFAIKYSDFEILGIGIQFFQIIAFDGRRVGDVSEYGKDNGNGSLRRPALLYK